MVVFAKNDSTAAFIKQNEVPVRFSSKGEGSEYEFDNDKRQFGVYARRNVGYGYWQQACHVTLV